jgi:hypothetical protein
MSSPNHEPRARSVVLSFRFLGTALAGSLTMALVCTFAPLNAQVAVLGACVSILAGLFVAYVEQEDAREKRRALLLEKLRIPMTLAPEHDLFDRYCAFTDALTALAQQHDPVLRQFALLKLSSIAEQVRSLAQGQVVFTGTETWRTVYEQLLEAPELASYRSVAWVKTRDYWQDPPGRRSMRLNFDLVQRGLSIRRVLILRGELWPEDEPLPAPDIRPWIEQQHDCGIEVSVVRESEIATEADLLVDFGIYGDRAVGIQELDEQSRTIRFVLDFDRPSLNLAHDRWDRIALYATPYADLLDKSPPER